MNDSGNIINVLTFGHIPKHFGGKQSSGLANVIWALANNMNQIANEDLKVILAATDIHLSKTIISSTEIIGWKRLNLIVFMLFHPWLLLYYGYKTGKLFYKYKFPYCNLLIKMIFYHKSIYENRPDYIHLHGCTGIVFFEIWNIHKFNLFATMHGMNGQDVLIPGHNIFKKMERDFSSMSLKFVVFISNDLVSRWITAYGKPNWKMEVVLNAYDSDLFYYIQNKNSNKQVKYKYTIATLASISLLKGQVRVLEALAELNNPSIHYLCIGNGSYDQIMELKTSAKKNNISFEHTGYISPTEIREKLSNVDYMILPSSSEGFGLAFLESIACGVPVILPKTLPIARERDLLNSENSIFLDDESSESILFELSRLDTYHFSKEKVALSISKYRWKNMAEQYASIIRVYSDINKI